MTDPATDEVDGCDLDFQIAPLADDQADLFVLFAEALDPATPTTVSSTSETWRELFDARPGTR